MRETHRIQDNKSYWKQRWESIDADEVMLNDRVYPLKYTLEAISLKNRKQKILEAGCGAGRILSYLHQRNYNIVGIDFIESAINKIKNKNKNIDAYIMDILNTNFKDEEFDTILSFGLYHNFQKVNLIKSLNETKRILKKDGILCFSYRADNIQNLILDRLLKTNKNNTSSLKFHKLNLKKNELIKILEGLNLKIIKNYYVVNMPLLFHFKLFRSKDQKMFNEHLSRRDGYKLNFFGNILNKFFTFFFAKYYCNIHVIYCKKN